jgi:glyoxylase-like metal-dependent hydrolase (beta-lactamase superfamily II)
MAARVVMRQIYPLEPSGFPGGVGNTNKDPERFASLFGDVTSRIFDVYGDDTVVHPGHGLPTTLGEERPHLEEWRERGW